MNTTSCKNQSSAPIFNCKSHSHLNWEIICHIEGNNTLETVEDRTYPLIPGTVTVIPPVTPHAKCSETGFFDICVQAQDLRFPYQAFTVLDREGNIRMLMELLIKTLIRQETYYKAITDGLLEIICMEIRKNMEVGTASTFVDDLKSTIYDNIACGSFDLSGALESYGYHPDHVRRRFREMTGMSPLTYLTRLRINKAKMMLADSSFVSIADVAEKCGFRDSFYFSTCFRKAVGCSPMQFREKDSEPCDHAAPTCDCL